MPTARPWKPAAALALVLLLVAGGAAAAYNADRLYLTGKRSVTVAAADAYPAGALAPLTIGVAELDGSVVSGSPVSVLVNGKSMFSGKTGADGFLRAEVKLPNSAGLVNLTVLAGGETVERHATLKDSRLVLLSSDKPLYQPGQTIHLRAIVFDGSPLKAAAMPVELSVRDPNGDLLYKHATSSDAHGVATGDYNLTDQMPLGSYKLEADVGGKLASQTVRVDEYVLPRFDLSLEGVKSWYLVGDALSATMSARYSFGESVKGVATVTLRIYEGAWREERRTGALDSNGKFHFNFALPSNAIGLPGEGGRAVVELKYEATDVSLHVENESRVLPLAAQPFDLRALADSTIPGQNSTWSVIVTRPDGAPVEGARVDATLSGYETKSVSGPWSAKTDARGIASVTFPYASEPILTVNATLGKDSASQQFSLSAQSGLKITTSAPRGKVGDVVTFTIHYAGASRTSTVFYELASKDRTVDVGRVTLQNGVATVRVTLTPDMAPLLSLRAYKVEDDLSTIGERAVVGVEAPDGLKVDVKVNATRVSPGDPVTITFGVKNATGATTPDAVLGVSAVDQSVAEQASRYLTTLQAAALGVERELETPRWQIHAYVYGNGSIVPVLTDTVVSRGDLGTSGAPLRVDETGAAYAVQAAQLKTRAVVGYWTTILVLVSITVLWGIALLAGRLFHARRAFAVAAAFLMLGMGGATWIVIHEPMSQSSPSNAGFADDRVVDFADRDGFGAPMKLRNEAARPFAPVAMPVAGAWALDANASPAVALTTGHTVFESKDYAYEGDVAGAQAAIQEARKLFPETWAWQPLVLVGADGTASIQLVAPDRITTWDVQAIAHTPDARLGVGVANVTVFKTFFVDPDLPVSAVRNDEFPLRVTLYNYENVSKKIEVHLLADSWFTPLSGLTQVVDVGPLGVARADFLVKPVKVGTWNVSVAAKDGSRWDSVVKPFKVLPDGKAFPTFANGELKDVASVARAIALSPDRIAGSENAWVKIQSGRQAMVIDGAESFIQFVTGCGEQSLSGLDVDVLAYANVKAARKDALPAENELRYETIVTQGLAHELQYLVSDSQHAGRGIVWFPGDEQAHPWLTAWGLLTFDDAKNAGFTVDPAVFSDMQAWLKSAMKDGHWSMTQGEFNNPELAAKDVAATAYIARALLRTGVPASDSAVASALDYVRAHASDDTRDPYVAALALAALTEAGDRGAFASELAQRLESLKIVANGTAHWETVQTPYARQAGDRFGGGSGPFTIEATAYAILALDAIGGHSGTVDQGLRFLLESRRGGAWYGTQDTVVALTAVNRVAKDGPVDSLVTVSMNGQKVWSKRVDASNRDVTFLVDLRPYLPRVDAPNAAVADPRMPIVEVSTEGSGMVRWSLFVEEYRPWSRVVLERPAELALALTYDAKQVRVGGSLAAHAVVRYQGQADAARMVLVQLVAPVGFAFHTADFDAMKKSGAIDMFEMAGRELNVYLGELPRGEDRALDYHLDALLPVKATLEGVKAFDMYDPLVQAEAPPVQVVSEE